MSTDSHQTDKEVRTTIITEFWEQHKSILPVDKNTTWKLPSLATVRSILHNTTQQHWHRNRTDFDLTPLKFDNLSKPGGTFILSVGNITSRRSERFRDKWDRWTSQTFRGRAGQSLMVISAYQVVTDTPARGTTTVAAQQVSLLIQMQEDHLELHFVEIYWSISNNADPCWDTQYCWRGILMNVLVTTQMGWRKWWRSANWLMLRCVVIQASTF